MWCSTAMKNASIADYMTRQPHTVGSEQTISFALKMMQEHDFRHLPVLHGGKLSGIVSDRDLGLIAGLNDVNPDNTRVEEAMSAGVYTVTPETLLLEVLEQMVSHKYGSAVVVQGTSVVGIFTNHDALVLLTKSLA